MPDDDLENTIATGSTIDDYILSIADGIAQAQRELAKAAAPTPDNPNPITYQIPRLDFELRMTMEMRQDPTSGGAGTPLPNRKRLRVQPVTSGSQASIASTIKGSFVAVPAHGGKPLPILDVDLDPIDEDEDGSPDAVGISVRLTNTAGEALAGQEVQINIDRDLCRKLNEENGLSAGVAEGTQVEDAVVETDEAGLAHSRLLIGEAEVPGASIAVTTDAAGQTRTLIYRIPGA